VYSAESNGSLYSTDRHKDERVHGKSKKFKRPNASINGRSRSPTGNDRVSKDLD